ncbi:MAG: cobalamin biosynthesis protein [Pelagimonas sp.]|jgi:cobalt-precorrin 5A hydrolase|nr:cobalamin biosynthesis protein [Pelagimonas sp.]
MIVAGFGYRAGASLESLLDAYTLAGAGAGIAATAHDKARGFLFEEFAQTQALRIVPVHPQALETQDTVTQSQASSEARRTGSVAEAAALAAAGPGARLITPRVISTDKMATCALAIGDPT